jgi:hypothetical protein
MGRWASHVFTHEAPALPDNLFHPLSRIPPVAAQAGHPVAVCTEEEKPVVGHVGVLVDDPDNPHDLVTNIRTMIEQVWGNHADAVEKGACEILGVKELRDYFRKPGKGGFWDDHISRYSKSRRKAPIYWLLQSAKKNYGIWLYYHRLDKDLLFKALVNYVEPKIRGVSGQSAECSRQLEEAKAAGKPAKEIKQLQKQQQELEDFLSEMQDFEDKLRRAANLHLEPDLNDGVVLNIAPLHELVPWKEARKYWDELMDGKYEWSSIGKQLREKGLVK